MFHGLFIYAQDYLYDDKQEVLNFIQEISSSSYQINILDTTESVICLISGFENIKATYFFNEARSCDSIVLVYDCLQCLDKHIERIVSDSRGRRKWIKSDEKLYFGKSWMSQSIRDKQVTFGVPAMQVHISEPEAIITIYTAYFSKEEWRIKKSQRKKI